MKVYIDTREQKKIQNIIQFWEANKKKYPNIESIETKLLATSDISTADGFIGIERKSSADFIASICGGKLKQQLHELRQNFKHAFLFVEDFDGIFDCIKKTPRVHPNVIIGATASAFAHSQVPICYVGQFYAPIVLTMIEKFYDTKAESYSEEYTPIRRGSTKKEEQLNIIIGINGIGMTEGSKLLNHFNFSIKAIVDAPVEELMEIKRIGKTKAEHIKEILK